MTYTDAKEFIGKLLIEFEKKGVDHHAVEEIKKGNQKFIEVKISIKIK